MTPPRPAHHKEDEIAAGYLANARYWISVVRTRADRYQQELTDPALLDAVGDCSGMSILDAGCGEGSFADELTQRGARNVHGVDTCAPLIAAAREAFTDERLTFTVADVDSLPVSDSSVDVVVANRIPHALTDPHRRFHEFNRVLRPGGRLLLMSQHPCFYGGHEAIPSAQSPHQVNDYFSRRVVRRPFSVDGQVSPAPSVQPLYSLSAYIEMIVDAGFVVTGLDEPHPTPQQLADPWWAANFTRPLFMLIHCSVR